VGTLVDVFICRLKVCGCTWSFVQYLPRRVIASFPLTLVIVKSKNVKFVSFGASSSKLLLLNPLQALKSRCSKFSLCKYFASVVNPNVILRYVHILEVYYSLSSFKFQDPIRVSDFSLGKLLPREIIFSFVELFNALRFRCVKFVK